MPDSTSVFPRAMTPFLGRRFLGRLEYDASRLEVGKVCEESLELVKGLRQAPDTSASPVVNLQIIVRLLEAKDILAADRGGTSGLFVSIYGNVLLLLHAGVRA
jgi:hypothetical protein